MADAVAAQLDIRRLPAAERLRRRGQPRVDAEVVQQAIGIQRQEVSLISSHRLFERTVQQPHRFRREGTCRWFDLVGDARRDGRRDFLIRKRRPRVRRLRSGRGGALIAVGSRGFSRISIIRRSPSPGPEATRRAWRRSGSVPIARRAGGSWRLAAMAASARAAATNAGGSIGRM